MAEILRFTVKDLLKEKNLKKVYVVLSKTKSIFNRDLKELPNIKKVVALYIHKYPFLAEYTIKILPRFPNAYYSMVENQFVVGLFNANILAHEFEHAASTRGAPGYKKLLGLSKLLSGITAKVTLPSIAAGTAIKGFYPEYKSSVNTAYDVMSGVHGLASLPILYEEGKANLFAILNSPEKMKALATLLPAYGTYLGKSALPIGIYQTLKKT
ncbi:MAG: hypothetical protein ACTSPI_00090 [Candidatus Heimdallarchaeaceae archaeon]